MQERNYFKAAGVLMVDIKRAKKQGEANLIYEEV